MLRGFHQKAPKMLVPRLRDSQSVCFFSAAMLAGNQTEIRRKLIRLPEAPEIADLCNERKRCVRFNPDQAAKLTYLLPVFFHLRVFCNLRIIKVLHFLRVVIPAKVLPKCVLQYGIPKVQLIQPVQVLLL